MAVRGVDGTGVLWGSTLGKLGVYESYRYPADPFAFDMQIPTAREKRMSSTMNNFQIGHTRAATVGGICVEATQPFLFDKIGGCHNGTLKGDYKDYPSDSWKLLFDINFDGLDKTILKLDAKDAYALVWIDRTKKRLNMLRNDKRQLFFAINDDRSVIYWCSEIDALNWILRRNQQKFHAFYTPEDTVVSFDPANVRFKSHENCYTMRKLERPPEPETKVIPFSDFQSREYPTTSPRDANRFDNFLIGKGKHIDDMTDDEVNEYYALYGIQQGALN